MSKTNTFKLTVIQICLYRLWQNSNKRQIRRYYAKSICDFKNFPNQSRIKRQRDDLYIYTLTGFRTVSKSYFNIRQIIIYRYLQEQGGLSVYIMHKIKILYHAS